MSFSHLKHKIFQYRKALKEFQKCKKEEKNYSSFKTGYYKGFNDCLKWIIKIFGVENVGELKKLTVNKNKNDLISEETV